ncbi:MAG: metallophosphoesterase [Clostridia bacterium]|nr:metallophosphoesterase [Clostridia bacterium]
MKRAFFLLLLLGWLAAFSGAAESILVISDLHLTENVSDFVPAMTAVQQQARKSDVLLLLGDNTNNGKPAEHQLLLQWLEKTARETGVQVCVIPGNHDLGQHVDRAAFAGLYAAFGPDRAFARDEGTASYAVMTPGGACLLMLDTNAYDSPTHVIPTGGIRAETITWVDSVLAGLDDAVPVIACGHHPLLPESRYQATPGAVELADVMARRGVTLYLCGHDHGFATVDDPRLRQITVGQPHAYPGWGGAVSWDGAGIHWRAQPLYAPDSAAYTALRQGAEALGDSMARGTLRGTAYQDDPGAIGWFTRAFVQSVGGELTPEICADLLNDENCRKWREIETRTVVKDWMLGLLENCPLNVKRIDVPLRRGSEWVE